MTWTDEAVAQVAADPTTIRTLFAIAGRLGGEGSRLRLLQALESHLDEELPDLYRFGDTNERVAILHALPALDADIDLARDALRTNDVRLVKAALNDYTYQRLSSSEIDHAIMKCVFMDIPLGSVPGLIDQATESTSRMLADFVDERTVAGRSIENDVFTIIERFPRKAD